MAVDGRSTLLRKSFPKILMYLNEYVCETLQCNRQLLAATPLSDATHLSYASKFIPR